MNGHLPALRRFIGGRSNADVHGLAPNLEMIKWSIVGIGLDSSGCQPDQLELLRRYPERTCWESFRKVTGSSLSSIIYDLIRERILSRWGCGQGGGTSGSVLPLDLTSMSFSLSLMIAQIEDLLIADHNAPCQIVNPHELHSTI